MRIEPRVDNDTWEYVQRLRERRDKLRRAGKWIYSNHIKADRLTELISSLYTELDELL